MCRNFEPTGLPPKFLERNTTTEKATVESADFRTPSLRQHTVSVNRRALISSVFMIRPGSPEKLAAGD